MLYQPSRQVSGAAEIEQGIGQGLQLLQWQSLDTSGGGLAQGAAAAAELAQSDGSGLGSATTGFTAGFALLAALRQQVLRGAGVEQLVGGDAGEHHEFLGGECGQPLKQHSENGGK